MNTSHDNRDEGPDDRKRKVRGLDLKGASGLGLASTVGLTIVIATVIGYLIGHWLDKVFGTDPIFLAVFVLLGAGAGFYEVYRLSERMSEDDRK